MGAWPRGRTCSTRSARATRTSTATNYSMIADRFCSFDERWISIGDAAYFVDPLFSSGVAFTAPSAGGAPLVPEAGAAQQQVAQAVAELLQR